MGTPEFAVASLGALLEIGCQVVGVVTAPDKPAGRGQQLQQSAVKKYATEKGLKVLQPEKLKDEKFIEELKKLDADLQIVVAFRMLPESVWNMPRLGTYNLHASLLPKYRGAAPINWAIINGETETGVTTFKLKHAIDTGNILFYEKVAITNDMNAGELHDLLMQSGSKLLVKTVNELEQCDKEQRQPVYHEQDNGQACHAPKLFKETCRINWSKSGTEICNLIRGLSPYPGAYTQLVDADGNAKQLKIFKAAFNEQDAVSETNGKLITDNKSYLKISCAKGSITVSDVQLEGKKRMRVEEFLRGFNMPENFRAV